MLALYDSLNYFGAKERARSIIMLQLIQSILSPVIMSCGRGDIGLPSIRQSVCPFARLDIELSYTLPKELLETCAEYTSNGIHRKFHLEMMYFSLMRTLHMILSS